MATELQLEYRLRWMDFDQYGRIQPCSVFDIFQDVATVQATTMGMGHADMDAKNVFWVVVRMKYEVVRQPGRLQVVKARTWPRTPSRFMFPRDYSMLDEQGNVLVKASSEWVVLDKETRNFVKISEIYDGSEQLCEDRAFDGKLRKIPSFEGSPDFTCTVIPSFTDCDQNGHVNNAKYANFIMDALDLGPEAAVRTFQIDYRHEVWPGVPLEIQTLVQDGQVLAKGIDADGDVAFACVIELA